MVAQFSFSTPLFACCLTPGTRQTGISLGSMKHWNRPLIVGASGQVGTALYQAFERRGRGERVMRSSREARPGWLRLDLAEIADNNGPTLLDELTPDLILCTGGMTFVDGCETNSEASTKANHTGPAALARYAQRHGASFVFFSTDYVFSGSPESPGPYAEEDQPEPLSVYGRTKLEGERAVLEAHPEALVIRTTVVYGPDEAGKNFLYTLLRYPSMGQKVRVAADQISTPTYNRDLAEATLALVDARASGMVHVAGSEVMDRLQFAQQVAGFFGLREDMIEGVTTASLNQAAARPLHSGLRTQRLEELLPTLRGHTVGEALGQCEPELRRFLAALPRQP